MGLIDQIGAGTNPAVIRMQKWHMNAERRSKFGDLPLTLFERSHEGTGESELMTLTEDWTARHIQDETLKINYWEIEIFDRAELTTGIMNKWATATIGTLIKIKIQKRDKPVAERTIWYSVGEPV